MNINSKFQKKYKDLAINEREVIDCIYQSLTRECRLFDDIEEQYQVLAIWVFLSIKDNLDHSIIAEHTGMSLDEANFTLGLFLSLLVEKNR